MSGQLGPLPATLLGLPRVLPESLAISTKRYLEQCWRDLYGRDVETVEADLRVLERFFHPLRTGRSLRLALQDLPRTRANPPEGIPEGLLLELRDGRRLVTPEGRLAVACLSEADYSQGECVIGADLFMRAQDQIWRAYRSWTHQRLTSIVRIEKAGGHALHPFGLGLLLLLLINRSTDREHALALPREDERARRLEQAVARILEAFANVIRPSTRGRRASLWSGYAVSETRRLSGCLAPDTARLYIADSVPEDDVLKYIAGELRRRKTSAGTGLIAFDHLMSEYLRQKPILAAFGVAHERGSATERLRLRLADRLHT